jgi:hypothetical protein
MANVTKSQVKKPTSPVKQLKSSLATKIPILPEKFYTFTHEGISMIWIDESSTNPIRGTRRRH